MFHVYLRQRDIARASINIASMRARDKLCGALDRVFRVVDVGNLLAVLLFQDGLNLVLVEPGLVGLLGAVRGGEEAREEEQSGKQLRHEQKAMGRQVNSISHYRRPKCSIQFDQPGRLSHRS